MSMNQRDFFILPVHPLPDPRHYHGNALQRDTLATAEICRCLGGSQGHRMWSMAFLLKKTLYIPSRVDWGHAGDP